MALFRAVPLTLLPFLLFNSIHFFYNEQNSSEQAGLAVIEAYDPFKEVLVTIDMVSGAEWRISSFDLLIVFGLVCLFFEILKSASASKLTIVDHILSAFVFISYLVEFMLVEVAAHSAFFILGLIALIDVIAGFTISIHSARRDVVFSSNN